MTHHLVIDLTIASRLSCQFTAESLLTCQTASLQLLHTFCNVDTRSLLWEFAAAMALAESAASHDIGADRKLAPSRQRYRRKQLVRLPELDRHIEPEGRTMVRRTRRKAGPKKPITPMQIAPRLPKSLPHRRPAGVLYTSLERIKPEFRRTSGVHKGLHYARSGIKRQSGKYNAATRPSRSKAAKRERAARAAAKALLQPLQSAAGAKCEAAEAESALPSGQVGQDLAVQQPAPDHKSVANQFGAQARSAEASSSKSERGLAKLAAPQPPLKLCKSSDSLSEAESDKVVQSETKSRRGRRRTRDHQRASAASRPAQLRVRGKRPPSAALPAALSAVPTRTTTAPQKRARKSKPS